MSILIVDDFADNVVLLDAILRKAGYEGVLHASSAKEAYAILEKEGAIIELILLDVMMPEISGLDACRKIKSDPVFRDLPVLMVTARTDMECLEEAFEAGAMDYITKPVRKVEFLARVSSALRLKHEMDERKQREKDLRKEKENLEKAMAEINILRGFLPICSYCKKIRDVKGLWHQIEAYLMSHSEVKFTHGICEVCLKGHYPDIADRVTDKARNQRSHEND